MVSAVPLQEEATPSVPAPGRVPGAASGDVPPMQIPPTTALLHALSSLPTGGAARAPKAAPATPAPRPTGALVAVEKALTTRGLAPAARVRTAESQAPVPAQAGAAPPPRNLPRGSLVNIVV